MHKVKRFRIYYDGGEIYEGAPENAPAWGVLVIVQENRNHGRELVTTKDYFIWQGDEGWRSVDLIGMHDYLQQPGWKRVLFGRMVADDNWNATMKRANDDATFPERTAWGRYEVRACL